MDFKKMSILYGCFYCKKKVTCNKNRIIQHLENGCRKMKNKCSCAITIQTSESLKSCCVYLNETNYHLDIEKDVLPLLRWPETVQHFTTRNDWKTLRVMDENWSSSEESDIASD
jgi:hypothetical protein